MDTEVQAPEQAGAEDEAVWSRAWEWPGWLVALGRLGRAAGRFAFRWRPDPRTLAVLLAIVAGSRLPGAITLAKPSWQAAFHPLNVPDPFLVDSDSLRWERVIAGSYLGVLLGSALTFLAVPLLIAWPRRIAGYLVAAAGLLAGLGAAVAAAMAVFHLTPQRETRVSYVGDTAEALLLLVLLLYTGLRSRGA